MQFLITFDSTHDISYNQESNLKFEIEKKRCFEVHYMNNLLIRKINQFKANFAERILLLRIFLVI